HPMTIANRTKLRLMRSPFSREGTLPPLAPRETRRSPQLVPHQGADWVPGGQRNDLAALQTLFSSMFGWGSELERLARPARQLRGDERRDAGAFVLGGAEALHAAVELGQLAFRHARPPGFLGEVEHLERFRIGLGALAIVALPATLGQDVVHIVRQLI